MMAYNDLIETKEGITRGEIRDRIMVDAFFLQALQFMKNITQEELQKNGYYLIKTYEATTHEYEISSFRLKTCPEDHEILYGKSEKGRSGRFDPWKQSKASDRRSSGKI